MSIDHRRQQQLFEQALEHPPDERAAFLDGACGQDVELRSRIDALLDALGAADEFLAEPTCTAAGSDEQPGARIDRYELLEQIGEGGFGTVWMAEQQEPVRRKVALKVIKLGMDTRQVIARFEAERQALALMEHPSIAQVFDGGSTRGGRPYFVMELVRGVPITEDRDQAALGAPQRLELFQQVCNAVQHAHQKGVIHRDLKPNNVLVTLDGGAPLPKVIDFGIAKATSAELTQRTLLTELRQMVGTPEYMAPEQAELPGVDVDTRTDVYSLGVVLYELLTGTKPFDARALLDKGYGEMLRVIREDEPQKPSTRVSTLGGELAVVARHRHATPAVLSRSLRGDLDWIVMKALEKDRSRRYATANDLAADIGRHLQDEPVDAGPPTAAYRLRKFMRRNRATVTAGALLATALVLGIAGTSYGMVRANEHATKASAAAASAEAAAQAEAKARADAQDSEKRAKTIAEFVTKALESSDPEYTGGKQSMTILAAMDNAIRDIGSGRFADDPKTEVALQTTIADVLRHNGFAAKAEPLLVQALETNQRLFADDNTDLWASLNNLAMVWENLGREKEAEPLLVQALEMSQRLHPGGHANVATTLNNLAFVRASLGRAREAEDLYVQALEMCQQLHPGEDHREVATTLRNLAWLRYSTRRVSEAEPPFVQALEMFERLHRGEAHPDVVTSLNGLAMVLGDLGRGVEAESAMVRALEMNQRLYPDDHSSVARSLSNLASVRLGLRRAKDAEPLFEQALEMYQRLYPDGDSRVATLLENLAFVRVDLDRKKDAEPLLVRALEMRQRINPGDHRDVATSLCKLARVRHALGKATEARDGFAKAIAMLRRTPSAGSMLLVQVLFLSASARLKDGDPEAALPELQEAVAMAEKLLPDTNPQLAVYRNALVKCRADLAK